MIFRRAVTETVMYRHLANAKELRVTDEAMICDYLYQLNRIQTVGTLHSGQVLLLTINLHQLVWFDN